jgi:hypothetical protein
MDGPINAKINHTKTTLSAGLRMKFTAVRKTSFEQGQMVMGRIFAGLLLQSEVLSSLGSCLPTGRFPHVVG